MRCYGVDIPPDLLRSYEAAGGQIYALQRCETVLSELDVLTEAYGSSKTW